MEEYVCKYEPLAEEEMKIMSLAIMSEKRVTQGEQQDPKALAKMDKELDQEFLIQVLKKRIDVFKLPISFNTYAKLSILALVKVPGELVLLLIDCLNLYEGKEVTVADLIKLYPAGFYDIETFTYLVDTQVETGEMKWSQIY